MGIFKTIRKNPRESIVATLVGIGVIGFSYLEATRDPRNEIFRGNIKGWNVVYQENPNSNYLSASKDNVTYQCFDTENSNPIDSFAKNPKPLVDKLEKVVYTDNKGTETLLRNDNSILFADQRIKLLDEIGVVYNIMRAEIRTQKQKEISDRLKTMSENLK